jgi:hypothetical protein
MDYEKKEQDIVSYVEANFNNFTETPVNYYLNEYLDFDAFNYDKAIFFQFNGYDYQELTNESQLETLDMEVFIVVRNDTEKSLHKLLRHYAGAFFNMFEASGCNLGGIADIGTITEVKFYDAVEGNKNIKLCNIKLTLLKETWTI